ncbi:MAG TPA: GNAT family N-acetyltransferase [Verrucomicrobiae bacterium]|nr:GNAT family N-acetyltransferase [Verrucomicrobiae bacterium]
MLQSLRDILCDFVSLRLCVETNSILPLNFRHRMTGQPRFRIEILNPAVHRREEFACESPELSEFLRTRARKEAKSRTSACFVIVPVADPGQIAGFYTLSATTIELEKLPAEFTRKLPRYPRLPATLLGRLARAIELKGQGIGGLLMVDALKRAYENSAVIGSVAVVVDPKDEKAAKFYAEFGFRALDGQKMFLPMKTIPDWLGLKQEGET